MIILVVGKTCSGKDAVAHLIEDKYKFHRVVTYTTRPMRSDDVHGVSHNFITEEEAAKFNAEDIFSPTEIDGYKYFMLKSQLTHGNKVMVVDPKGVEDVAALGVDYRVIYIYVPEDMILNRARVRGDNLEVVKSRLEAERERFDKFRDSCEYIHCIANVETWDVLRMRVEICMDSILYVD